MFIDNKYSKWYHAIIENAHNRLLSGYVEKHHIIPKSIGGLDVESNLVTLTAREHFVCHLLLTKMLTGSHKQKMIHAAWSMCNLVGPGQFRYKVSGRIYESLRRNHAVALSLAYTGVKNPKKGNPGETNPFYGKKHSDETKEKIRQARIGKKDSNELRRKKSEAAKNRPPVTEATREKLSKINKGKAGLTGERNGFFGKQHSPEQRDKKRQEKLAAVKKVCYYCQKEVDPMNYSRWHGEHCKHKT